MLLKQNYILNLNARYTFNLLIQKLYTLVPEKKCPYPQNNSDKSSISDLNYQMFLQYGFWDQSYKFLRSTWISNCRKSIHSNIYTHILMPRLTPMPRPVTVL